MPYKDPSKKRAWQNKSQQTLKWKNFIWEYNLKRKYGINSSDYEELLIKQNGNCALCPKTESRPGYKLAVDHCHSTGKVRGLLCYECNRSLSKNKDTDYYKKVIEYLERPAEHIVEVDKNGKFLYT